MNTNTDIGLELRVKLINLLHKHGKMVNEELDQGEKIDEMVERIVAERDQARAQLAELRADGERWKWWQEWGWKMHHNSPDLWTCTFGIVANEPQYFSSAMGHTLEELIDNARAEQSKLCPAAKLEGEGE